MQNITIKVHGKNGGRVGTIEHGEGDDGAYWVAPRGHGAPNIVSWYPRGISESDLDALIGRLTASIVQTAALYGRH